MNLIQKVQHTTVQYTLKLYFLKGYFRLAKALGASKDFEAALNQIKEALRLAPEDKTLLREEQYLKKMKKTATEAEKKKYSKMFG